MQLSVSKGLGPRVDFFEKQLRIPEAEIPKLIERNPAVLTLSIENQINELEEDIPNFKTPRNPREDSLQLHAKNKLQMLKKQKERLETKMKELEEQISTDMKEAI